MQDTFETTKRAALNAISHDLAQALIADHMRMGMIEDADDKAAGVRRWSAENVNQNSPAVREYRAGHDAIWHALQMLAQPNGFGGFGLTKKASPTR